MNVYLSKYWFTLQKFPRLFDASFNKLAEGLLTRQAIKVGSFWEFLRDVWSQSFDHPEYFQAWHIGIVAESNEHRKRVIEECHNNSIETRVWSHGNLGKHKFWTNRYGEFNGEVANKIYERGFIVPTHPFLNVEDIDFISEVCNGV